MTEPADAAAIARATGRAWPEWVAAFEAAGGAALDHRALVEVAARDLRHVDNPGWWAQMTAVAYERHLGRRAVGQRQDGSFEASASRTLGGTLDEAMDAWTAATAPRSELAGVPYAAPPTATATDAYRRWRVALDDGTRVLAQASLRSGGAVLTLTWSRLGTADDRERARAALKELLAGL
ncbi:hypothetical protein QQX09_00450 [Demequina sp. SYSU T00192]|uniref:Uncharacterized protein n=1 Tax=Demequina litoralis TaxID=3051660 RepID=A0ABT8G5B3_9MICO|nr:hypothetical protein [Demequina sp. SYSU T00192]MDN4474317.1 hypothetical protein [Demequina sp. SYSU T00192]